MTAATQDIPAGAAHGERAGARRRDGQFRLALSSRAPAFFRIHVNRNMLRIATLAAGDVVTLVAIWLVLAALMISHGSGPTAAASIPLSQYVIAVVLGLGVSGCYRSGDQRRDPGTIARATALGTGLALWGTFWAAPTLAAVLPLLGVWLASTLALLGTRHLVDWIVRLVRPAPQHVMRAIVIGSVEQALELIDHPAVGERPWCHLVGNYDPRGVSDGDLSAQIARLIQLRRVDTIVLSGSLEHRAYCTLLDAAVTSGCHVISFPRVSPTPMLTPRLVWRDGVAMIEHTRPGSVGAELMVKRGIDIIGAACALIVAAPVMAIVALLIRRDGDGPVLFRQERIGQGGRRFRIVKFRTMTPGSERLRESLRDRSVYCDGRLFKIPGDPRITPLGAVLRRTSLDELPQLWNVLIGEMSLVGPRPPLPSEVERYHAKDYARFDVKPGITGPWQVSGRNAIQDFDEVVRLETSYIQRWSVWRDLGLMLRTVPAVLSGRGAQ